MSITSYGGLQCFEVNKLLELVMEIPEIRFFFHIK